MNITLSPRDETKFAILLANGVTVEIPVTEAGAKALAKILRENARADAQGAPKRMATPAVPLQHQIDAWLRAGGEVHRIISPKEARERASALTLEDLL